jgi:hypothetical protein
LRAWAWLPAASAAHRAALATCVLAALQAWVLHGACRAWGARAFAATLAVGVFAAAPLVLRVHGEADVFALNSLVAAGVLWLAAPDGPQRGARRVVALALVAGLGLANNLTCVLLAPVGLYGIVRGLREAAQPAFAAALGLVALVVGLSPYLYDVVAPASASWGRIDSFGELIDLILRHDYGYTSHVASASASHTGAALLAYSALCGRSWLYVLAIAGVVALVRAPFVRADRWAWAMLGASWLLAGPALTVMLGIDPSGSAGVGGYIGGRMQIMSLSVLAVPVAIALDSALARVPRAAARWPVAVVVILVLVASALPRLHRVHASTVELGVRNLLVTLPDRAVAIVVSEDQCFGARYLQLVEHVRPDVTVACATLLSRAWYRERLGVPLATLGQREAVLADRPLLVDGAQRDVLSVLPSYPYGVLDRVLPRGASVPSLADVIAIDREVYARFDLDDVHPDADDDFAAVAHLRYAATWRRLAKALAGAGDPAGAAQLTELARDLAPR